LKRKKEREGKEIGKECGGRENKIKKNICIPLFFT